MKPAPRLPDHALVAYAAEAPLYELCLLDLVRDGLYVCPACDGAGTLDPEDDFDCLECLGYGEVQLDPDGVSPNWRGTYRRDRRERRGC